MVALDEFGNILGHGMIFVIGKDEERRKKTRTRLADMVKQHNVEPAVQALRSSYNLLRGARTTR